MSNHTPGPWVYGRANNYEGFYIAPANCLPTLASVQVGCKLSDGSRSHVNTIECFNFPGETEANAALIASAPDLLAERDALRAVLREILTIDDGTSVVHLPSALRERAQELCK